MLHADVPLHGEELTSVADFTIHKGESKSFVLSWRPSHKPAPDPIDTAAALRETEEYWRDWSSKCSYDGEFREPVLRSLLTLKALTYGPTGGIVAAPTTSLPEEIGGIRNWDYRLCWLRDATLTLIALMDAGYYDEALAWRDWLLRAAAGSPDQLQIMYGLGGERRLLEWEASWLPGYEGSRPVRIGNAAHGQLQIDVFGEVMDALHQARKGKMPESEDAWRLELALVKHLESVCRRAGSRHLGGARPAAALHALQGDGVGRARPRDQERRAVPPRRPDRPLVARCAPSCTTRSARAASTRSVGSFMQAYGSAEVDASLLLMPLVGFLPADDPAHRRHRALHREAPARRRLRLSVRLVRSPTTDFRPAKGAFLACTFWLVDNYLLQGRHAEARGLFDRLLGIRNDVGLLAEEYHPSTRAPRRQLPAGVLARRAREHGVQHAAVGEEGGAEKVRLNCKSEYRVLK